MNEIRDILLGIDFGRENSQICYYNRKADEVLSISMKVGSSQYEIPTCLCRRIAQKDFCIGVEAEYFAREKGDFLIENLYEICEMDAPVAVEDEMIEPSELLAEYFRHLLKFLGMADPVKNIKCLSIAVSSLDKNLVKNLQSACEKLKFRKAQLQILDYGECFYYYALAQKKETWNRYVGWYDFQGDRATFRRLSMNIKTKLVLVRLEDPLFLELPLGEEDKDAAFCQFVQQTLRTDLYSSVQITGDGFDTQWANKSIKALCRNHRKVFAGNNLFAKGACEAGRERLEKKSLKGYLYLSESLVTVNVGMEMTVMGSPAYYSLIEAGHNWYECSAEYDLILDDTEELVFLINQMGEKNKKRVGMLLPGIPERPNRTTRLRVSLVYRSPKQCDIMVRDLGFGEMFPSSGKVWKESMEW